MVATLAWPARSHHLGIDARRHKGGQVGMPEPVNPHLRIGALGQPRKLLGDLPGSLTGVNLPRENLDRFGSTRSWAVNLTMPHAQLV